MGLSTQLGDGPSIPVLEVTMGLACKRRSGQAGAGHLRGIAASQLARSIVAHEPAHVGAGLVHVSLPPFPRKGDGLD